MPDKIVNAELYADRTVQDWHRERFPRSWKAIDLDLVGICGRCKHSLYLIEATTNPQKFTTYLVALAKDSDVPALLVFHNRERVTGGRLVYPWTAALAGEDGVTEFLTELRDSHLCEYRQTKETAA